MLYCRLSWFVVLDTAELTVLALSDILSVNMCCDMGFFMDPVMCSSVLENASGGEIPMNLSRTFFFI